MRVYLQKCRFTPSTHFHPWNQGWSDRKNLFLYVISWAEIINPIGSKDKLPEPPVFVSYINYGSIPINSNFRGMNIHLPAIMMFTRGTRFWHTAIWNPHFFQRILIIFLLKYLDMIWIKASWGCTEFSNTSLSWISKTLWIVEGLPCWAKHKRKTQQEEDHGFVPARFGVMIATYHDCAQGE